MDQKQRDWAVILLAVAIGIALALVLTFLLALISEI